MEKKLSYKQAGVDISAGEDAVSRIKPLTKKTFTPNVLTELGSFGALYRFDVAQWKKPILVSSTDGVGTKILIAQQAGIYTTVGQDLINHCVNDILVQGARPLFFMDYIGAGMVEPAVIEGIVSGLSKACCENKMALIGGEIAEMPDVYKPQDFDLAGTIVGCVDEEKVITGKEIQEGDVVLGLGSTGLHTNGYSLARKIIFDVMNLSTDSLIPDVEQTVAEAFLAVHRSYLPQLLPLIEEKEIKGLAHITGGGIPGNLKRIIPDGYSAEIQKKSWDIPPLFAFLQKAGHVEIDEMYKTFNMGIGMIVVTSPEHSSTVMKSTDACVIGTISKGKKKVNLV